MNRTAIFKFTDPFFLQSAAEPLYLSFHSYYII